MSLVILDPMRRILAADLRINDDHGTYQDNAKKTLNVGGVWLAAVGVRRPMDLASVILEENPEAEPCVIAEGLADRLGDDYSDDFDLLIVRDKEVHIVDSGFNAWPVKGYVALGSGSQAALALLRILPVEAVFRHVAAVVNTVSKDYVIEHY